MAAEGSTQASVLGYEDKREIMALFYWKGSPSKKVVYSGKTSQLNGWMGHNALSHALVGGH